MSLIPIDAGWHVYGLLYRSDKNYEEAMKCYRYALKYDKVFYCVFRGDIMKEIHEFFCRKIYKC